jgi:hypothetical protein
MQQAALAHLHVEAPAACMRGPLHSAGARFPKCDAHAQTKDGQKMGKSLGNVLEPRALLAAYGADAVRFFFLREVAFGQARMLPTCPGVSVDSIYSITDKKGEGSEGGMKNGRKRFELFIEGVHLGSGHTGRMQHACLHWHWSCSACKQGNNRGWNTGELRGAAGMVAQDGDFSEQRFRDIVNAALANSVGNLLNRTLGLLKKNCGGALPAGAASIAAGHPLRSVAEAQVCHAGSCPWIRVLSVKVKTITVGSPQPKAVEPSCKAGNLCSGGRHPQAACWPQGQAGRPCMSRVESAGQQGLELYIQGR